MQKNRVSHEAAHIMLVCLSNVLFYHDSYDLFCFIALLAANIEVKTSTAIITHMYDIYVTNCKVHNQNLNKRF